MLAADDYGKYLSKSLQAAERGARDSFHCRSANCIGWCFYEDDVNNFICPICGKNNCLTCKAIHPDQSCQEYQDDLKIRAENDEAAKKTQQMLQVLITVFVCTPLTFYGLCFMVNPYSIQKMLKYSFTSRH